MNQHIAFAYEINNGLGNNITSELIANPSHNTDKLLWVHLDSHHSDTMQWIEQSSPDLEPFILDALFDDETRPRMAQINHGLLLILRGVNLSENADPEDMVSIRLYIEKNRIISVYRRRLKAIRDIEEKIISGKGPKDVGQFICMLTSQLTERLEPAVSKLDELTDDAEENLLENVDASLRGNIVQIRKQAIMFRRYMAPQRDAIGQLCLSDLDWFDDMHRRHLRESHNHVIRYIEDLDAIRERAQIVKDELGNILADKQNKNMYLLSIVAAIFLPLGFITGLFGINVGGMPGVSSDMAFWIVCLICLLFIIVVAGIFKFLKWY